MRNKVITIRVSDREYDRISAQAEKAGGTLSDYVRKCAVNGKVVLYDTKDVYGLKTELAVIGKNINQIAKVANSTGVFFAQDMDDVTKAVTEVIEIVKNHLSPLTCREL